MKFYFIRHGETDWNKEKRLQGRTDIPLNETGRQQARDALKKIIPLNLDLIVSSPLIRAKETALIINETLRLPIHFDDRLVERCFGKIEGMRQIDIITYPEHELFDLQIPFDAVGQRIPLKAETIEAVAERAHFAITHHLGLPSHKNVLFCAHGAWFRSLIFSKTGEVMHPNNAAPYLCDFTDNMIVKIIDDPQ